MVEDKNITCLYLLKLGSDKLGVQGRKIKEYGDNLQVIILK